MSTKFGILTEPIEHEKLVDENGDLLFYISEDVFEPVFFIGTNSGWLNYLSKLLPNETKVYALDNSHQGILTIGDCKAYLEQDKKL